MCFSSTGVTTVGAAAASCALCARAGRPSSEEPRHEPATSVTTTRSSQSELCSEILTELSTAAIAQRDTVKAKFEFKENLKEKTLCWDVNYWYFFCRNATEQKHVQKLREKLSGARISPALYTIGQYLWKTLTTRGGSNVIQRVVSCFAHRHSCVSSSGEGSRSPSVVGSVSAEFDQLSSHMQLQFGYQYILSEDEELNVMTREEFYFDQVW